MKVIGKNPTGFLALGLAALVVATVFAGCLVSDDDDHRLGVVVTLLPQQEFAERVGGDRVRVTVMVGPGDSPHTYAPTPRQLVEVAKAGLYFKVGSGVEFETVWLDTLMEQNPAMRVVDGSQGLGLIPFSTGGGEAYSEAAGLFAHGPFAAVAAGANESDAPTIAGGATAYNLSFDGEAYNRTGVVAFTPAAAGDYVVFLAHDTDELNFTLRDGAGEAVSPEAPAGHASTPFTWYAPFALRNETYFLHFGPTGEGNSTVVILAHEDHGHGGDPDPHIWNSPRNVIVMVQNLLAGLTADDPANAAYYTANAEAYIAELTALDDELATGLAPYAGSRFLVHHPSFGYLAHDYGLVQWAIEDEGKTPTAAGLQALIQQAEREGIQVVFVSPQYSSEQAQTIADEIGGVVAIINPLPQDYLANMREIRTQLLAALAPPEA